MEQTEVKDPSLTMSALMLKMCGAWMETGRTEEYRRKCIFWYTVMTLIYSTYVNVADCYYSWGDLEHCTSLFFNEFSIILGTVKYANLNIRRRALADLLQIAKRNFWHKYHNEDEKEIFEECLKFSKFFVGLMYCVTFTIYLGYLITPIVANIGKNQVERQLPFRMWVNLPLKESPYFELVFAFQMFCTLQACIVYICNEMIFIVLNIHIVGQFRILHSRLSKLWPTSLDQANEIRYVQNYYARLKECVGYHQVLIDFSNRFEEIFSLAILAHIVVFSALVCFDIYQLLLAKIPVLKQISFLIHLSGNVIHILFLTYTCHGLMEESTNVGFASYSGWWMNCPMSKTGAKLRKDLRFILMRSSRPCSLTAGGFFPVTMATSTSLFTSTLSYFTLMRDTSEQEK